MRAFKAAVVLLASLSSLPAGAQVFFGHHRGVSIAVGLPFFQAHVMLGVPPPPPVFVQAVPVQVVVPVAEVQVQPPPPPPPPARVVMVGYAAPQQVVQAVPPPEEPWRPGRVALKYSPNYAGTLVTSPSEVGLSGGSFSHGLGLEVRLSRWFALRTDVDFSRGRRTFDALGAKLWLAGGEWRVKPFISGGLSLTQLDARPQGVWVGYYGSAGLDIFVGKHLFFTAEARYRPMPESCGCSATTAAVHQVSGVVGVGVAFF
jgi:hypothetical protein